MLSCFHMQHHVTQLLEAQQWQGSRHGDGIAWSGAVVGHGMYAAL